MNIKAILSIVFVFVGCSSNVVVLEMVVKEDPGCGNFLTFLQFLFIAFMAFVTVGKFGFAKRRIPLMQYFILVAFFWLTSVANNYAFNFNISMPLHMIFRAGSLMANMAMGIWILKKTYPFSKYLAVLMISVGIAICTIQSSSQVSTGRKAVSDAAEEAKLKYIDWLWWCLGLVILTFAVLMSARLGIFQESLYAKYGKRPWEALYYAHMLPLIFWAPLAPDIINHAKIALASVPVDILGIKLPRQVLNLFVNLVTQGLCISSVYVLTSECTSLTVTLTLTLRKFLSLMFSIIYFKNPYTLGHWLGTLLVFIGTLIYTEILQKLCVLSIECMISRRKDILLNPKDCQKLLKDSQATMTTKEDGHNPGE